MLRDATSNDHQGDKIHQGHQDDCKSRYQERWDRVGRYLLSLVLVPSWMSHHLGGASPYWH